MSMVVNDGPPPAPDPKPVSENFKTVVDKLFDLRAEPLDLASLADIKHKQIGDLWERQALAVDAAIAVVYDALRKIAALVPPPGHSGSCVDIKDVFAILGKPANTSKP